ncbi:MAG: competence protein ComEC, partial [Phenylobacterium sp.]|nr:competence protein ComEC [Phenylobacterium sp.]
MVDQADRWSLWTPVAFGIGCAIYFALGREPLTWVAFGALGLAIALLVAARRSPVRRETALVLILAAFALAGFATAKLRTQAVAGPVAPAL